MNSNIIIPTHVKEHGALLGCAEKVAGSISTGGNSGGAAMGGVEGQVDEARHRVQQSNGRLADRKQLNRTATQQK